MTARIALLRGVNVGGANRLPMGEFREMLQEIGLERPVTYIQSGNAVFGSDLPAEVLETRIGAAISERFGFAPAVFLRDLSQMRSALSDHPFAGADPARVHVIFRRVDAPAPDEARVRAVATAAEEWLLCDGWLALHTPEGYGTSKLAAALPRVLPGEWTARNLRSVAALVALGEGRGPTSQT